MVQALARCVKARSRLYPSGSLCTVSRLEPLIDEGSCVNSLYYHYCILSLFRPFIKHLFPQFTVSPRDICSEAAENISSLTRSYRRLYTLRRTPSFKPPISLNATIIHLMNTNTPTAVGSTAIQQSISDLYETCIYHKFADKLIDVIHYLAQSWRITLPRTRPRTSSLPIDGTRPFQSLVVSLYFFSPKGPKPSSPELITDNLIGDIPLQQMTLFAPFPNQGLPFVSTANPSS